MQEYLNSFFDNAAKEYDDEFTYSLIGASQRKKVWIYLNKALDNKPNQKVLEVNCGTGVDAVMIAEKGHEILATDISTKMLEVASSKKTDLHKLLSFQVCDINDLIDFKDQSKFDLVFSNFGGLNCLSPEQLNKLSVNANSLLKDSGKFIAVVMPKYPFIEVLKLLMRLELKKILQKEKPLQVNVSDVLVKTWYYSPSTFFNSFSTCFKKKKVKPIGFFIPPSYMESWVKKHRGLFKFMVFLESYFSFWKWQASFSDHFYIEMQKR